jgi:hypothetical protein
MPSHRLHNMYNSPNILRVIKSRRMIWTGHVARTGQMKNVHNILVRKLKGRHHSEDVRVSVNRRWEWILGKQSVKVWTGCIWSKMESTIKCILVNQKNVSFLLKSTAGTWAAEVTWLNVGFFLHWLGDRVVKGRYRHDAFEYWGRGFEFHSGHGCTGFTACVWTFRWADSRS